MHRVSLLLLCFLGGRLLGHGQANQPVLFRETTLPESGSPRWFRLNRAFGYSVRRKGDKLVAGLGKNARTTRLRMAGGELRGEDYGEFGGRLAFQQADSKAALVEIKQGNVRLIFQLDSTVYFIEGLAHLSLSSGALYQLTGTSPRFGYTKLADFADAPEAFWVENHTVYIAQSRGFTVLRQLRPEVVVQQTFWGGLYPNSVAVFGDTVYVGMRGGYAQLVLTSKQIRFFQHVP